MDADGNLALSDFGFVGGATRAQDMQVTVVSRVYVVTLQISNPSTNGPRPVLWYSRVPTTGGDFDCAPRDSHSPSCNFANAVICAGFDAVNLGRAAVGLVGARGVVLRNASRRQSIRRRNGPRLLQ